MTVAARNCLNHGQAEIGSIKYLQPSLAVMGSMAAYCELRRLNDLFDVSA